MQDNHTPDREHRVSRSRRSTLRFQSSARSSSAAPGILADDAGIVVVDMDRRRALVEVRRRSLGQQRQALCERLPQFFSRTRCEPSGPYLGQQAMVR